MGTMWQGGKGFGGTELTYRIPAMWGLYIDLERDHRSRLLQPLGGDGKTSG